LNELREGGKPNKVPDEGTANRQVDFGKKKGDFKKLGGKGGRSGGIKELAWGVVSE